MNQRVFNFTHAKALGKKLNTFGEQPLFLLDYELRGQKETGLDVVQWLSENENSSDVDSHPFCYIVSQSFQDPTLQRECKKMGVGLFPKTLL